MARTSRSVFQPDALAFFRGLRRQNTKPWFEAHRDQYLVAVRDPLRQLVEEMDLRLAGMAPEIIGDPKRSAFRIHRDIRFSRDKSPYKTHAACWFYHRDASRKVGQDGEGGSAGFYFHVEPGASLLGAGIWMPARPALARIRDRIAEDPDGFSAIASDRALKRRFGGLDDSAVLKRMPRGYPEDHPAAGWLKYQSFIMGRTLTDAEVTGPRLPTILEQDYARLLPLVRWLNGALGLPPAKRR
ncbi:MAG: DUF2461 domain-containing protein [Gemmatimonadota bacterium]